MLAHSSSIGRLILGAMPEDEIKQLYKGASLKRPDGSSYRSIDDLVKSVRRDERRGYVITKGAYHPDIVAVAAPIFDRNGIPVAGLNVSGLASYWDAKSLEGIVKDQVCAAAKSVSTLLGYRQRETAK
jgi:IclR family pca regulon transcriptional regulator